MLLSMLTIFFVLFKLGESAQMMMSIYGDKGFLFYSGALKVNDVVGFVYDNANGGFASVASCTENAEDTDFKLNTNCTIAATAVVTITDATKGANKSLTDFPVSSTTTNMMVAKAGTKPVTAIKSADTTTTTATTITFTGTPTTVTFLCNALDETTSKTYFSGSAAAPSAITYSLTGSNYPAITKCVAAGLDANDASVGYGTFAMVVIDHADITNNFFLFAIPSAVVLLPSIDHATAVGTTVGYINGKETCPSSSNLTFPTTTNGCKGKITIKELGNDVFSSFSYNNTNYYLPVTGVNTTCDFAFDVNYSNMLIGMLLIFMLKMLNSS